MRWGIATFFIFLVGCGSALHDYARPITAAEKASLANLDSRWKELELPNIGECESLRDTQVSYVPDEQFRKSCKRHPCGGQPEGEACATGCRIDAAPGFPWLASSRFTVVISDRVVPKENDAHIHHEVIHRRFECAKWPPKAFPPGDYNHSSRAAWCVLLPEFGGLPVGDCDG